MDATDWVLKACSRTDKPHLRGARIDPELNWLTASDGVRLHCTGGFEGLPEGFLIEGGTYLTPAQYEEEHGIFPTDKVQEAIQWATTCSKIYPDFKVSGDWASFKLKGKEIQIREEYLREATELMDNAEFYAKGPRQPLIITQGELFAVICPGVDDKKDRETVKLD